MDLSQFVTRYYKPAVLALGIAVLYRGVLAELSLAWWDDPNYSHGLVLPFITAWLLWRRKGDFAAFTPAPSNFGLLVIAGALALFFLGELGAEFFLTRVSLLVLLAGLVLFFLGWQHLKIAAFPIGILLLAIPLPAVIFYQITFPLQVLASKLGSSLLEAGRVPVLREGNVIVLPDVTLQVAEACSGIRSLFTLGTLTIVYGYLAEEGRGMRWAIALSAIPLALFANGMRIMGTGMMAQYVSPQAAEGFFHTFSGWFIFVIALVMLFGSHRLFCWMRNLWKAKNATREESLITT